MRLTVKNKFKKFFWPTASSLPKPNCLHGSWPWGTESTHKVYPRIYSGSLYTFSLQVCIHSLPMFWNKWLSFREFQVCRYAWRFLLQYFGPHFLVCVCVMFLREILKSVLFYSAYTCINIISKSQKLRLFHFFHILMFEWMCQNSIKHFQWTTTGCMNVFPFFFFFDCILTFSAPQAIFILVIGKLM